MAKCDKKITTKYKHCHNFLIISEQFHFGTKSETNSSGTFFYFIFWKNRNFLENGDQCYLKPY